jgi:transcription elongation factor GreB
VAPGSQFITPAGAARLRAELDQLWLEERPRVTLAVAAAAAQGDRSENAEYTYGKKRLHEIDRRVRFLRKRLDGMTIVDPDDAGARRDPDRVYFGAWVQVESQDGGRRWHRIVGPDEFDMAAGYISMDSPLGRSLLRRSVGEEIRIDLPAGSSVLTIVAVQYRPRPSPTM